MTAYLYTTCILFALVTLAHIWRMIVEWPRFATDPFYVLLTALAAGLCLWGWRLLRLSPSR